MRHLMIGITMLAFGLVMTFTLASVLQRLGQQDHVRVAATVQNDEVSFLTYVPASTGAPSGRSRVSDGQLASAAVEHVGPGRSRAVHHPGNEAEAAPYSMKRNLVYGPHDRQKLDLYTPARPRADGKVVVFFYGGGLNSGSKRMNEQIGQLLASEGIVTVIPDYRLYPEVRFPAFIEDAALAVRWVADRFGADNIILMGHSAGAYLALMLASNSPYLAAAGVERTRLRAAIGLAGPYDVIPFQSAPYLRDVFQGGKDPNIYPATFANGELRPVLLIEGTADTTVEPGNARRLAALWRKSNGEASYRVYIGASHMDLQDQLFDTVKPRIPVYDHVLGFIDSH